MTVKEAIAILQTLNQELELTVYHSYDGTYFGVYAIQELPEDVLRRGELHSALHNNDDKMVLIR